MDERAVNLKVTPMADLGGAVVVQVAGEIDMRSAPLLRERLTEASDEAGGGDVIADFAAVEFCDATGLGALVAVQNRFADRGARLRLARVRPAQRRILRITRLDGPFLLHEAEAEAIGLTGAPTIS